MVGLNNAARQASTGEEMWPTPHASPQENRTTRRTPAQRDGRHGLYLSAEVHEQGRALYATPQSPGVDEISWPTPHSSCAMGVGRQGRDGGPNLQTAVADSDALVAANKGARQLSPDWVETLMALPIGWTDPDRAEPQDWPGWPARPGQPQHAYESPRLARGVKHRVSRLKALGNAVVAAQALPLFQAIMQVERAEREDGDANV